MAGSELASHAGGVLLYGRCDPYGAESGGPRRVLGGLHGPRSARTDPADLPGLPDAVREGEWACQNMAVVRVRMTCRCGHQGPVMPLCSWHDETVWHGEIVAGVTRRVSSLVRAPGHFEMIGRRQSGACTRCLFPRARAEEHHALLRHQQELAALRDRGEWYSPRAAYKRQVIEDIVKSFDQGNADGSIHRCPMTLVPVS